MANRSAWEDVGFNQTVSNLCGSKNSRQCHNSRNFDECTTAHNDFHRNRGFSPWQLLRGKTPTDKSLCENPDLAQCSVEVVDEAAKQRLRVKEESYKAYIEEELSLRKRREEIHQPLGGIGHQVTGAGIGELANTVVRQ